MTVAELIEELRDVPPEANVYADGRLVHLVVAYTANYERGETPIVSLHTTREVTQP